MNNTLDEQHDVKNYTSKDKNVGKHFMVTNQESLHKLERLMSPELK